MLEPESVKPPAADPLTNTGRSRIAERLGAALEIVLISGYPTQLLIGQALMAAGFAARLPDGRLSLMFVVTLWVIDAAAIFALIAALVHARGDQLAPMLFGQRPPWREAWLGLALVPVVFGIVILALLGVEIIWPALHNVPNNPFKDLVQSPLDGGILAAVAVLSGGIKEEVQRAFALRRFEQHLGGVWVGLVVFSVMFGAGHFMQGWDVGVVTTLLGVFWGVLYLRRSSAVASAVSHSGFNVAQIVQYVVFGS